MCGINLIFKLCVTQTYHVLCSISFSKNTLEAFIDMHMHNSLGYRCLVFYIQIFIFIIKIIYICL